MTEKKWEGRLGGKREEKRRGKKRREKRREERQHYWSHFSWLQEAKGWAVGCRDPRRTHRHTCVICQCTYVRGNTAPSPPPYPQTLMSQAIAAFHIPVFLNSWSLFLGCRFGLLLPFYQDSLFLSLTMTQEEKRTEISNSQPVHSNATYWDKVFLPTATDSCKVSKSRLPDMHTLLSDTVLQMTESPVLSMSELDG